MITRSSIPQQLKGRKGGGCKAPQYGKRTGKKYPAPRPGKG